jgi:hypothetical protein
LKGKEKPSEQLSIPASIIHATAFLPLRESWENHLGRLIGGHRWIFLLVAAAHPFADRNGLKRRFTFSDAVDGIPEGYALELLKMFVPNPV